MKRVFLFIALFALAGTARGQDDPTETPPRATTPPIGETDIDRGEPSAIETDPSEIIEGTVIEIGQPEAAVVLAVARVDGETEIFRILDASKIRDADGIPIPYTAVERGDRVVIERTILDPAMRRMLPYEDVRRVFVQTD